MRRIIQHDKLSPELIASTQVLTDTCIGLKHKALLFQTAATREAQNGPGLWLRFMTFRK
jgi:predicted nucleic acid-binding protein